MVDRQPRSYSRRQFLVFSGKVAKTSLFLAIAGSIPANAACDFKTQKVLNPENPLQFRDWFRENTAPGAESRVVYSTLLVGPSAVLRPEMARTQAPLSQEAFPNGLEISRPLLYKGGQDIWLLAYAPNLGLTPVCIGLGESYSSLRIVIPRTGEKISPDPDIIERYTRMVVIQPPTEKDKRVSATLKGNSNSAAELIMLVQKHS